ncbi:MAG: hypothetical protein FXF49_04820 [Flexistipes sinusarabici]|uniref:Transglutaminase-like domain-containing protein n=1 Tax=Flexistipes sinusarabici TaxID=2352 RepID=A0A5D0MMW1_FLESI|nr:transglutaminase-like domain-containing protein [Flexistipes sinusarabici]TYB33732.1 MAG: hypothetical protein FXF49_04820 [Flexistipes sinusarabici]
MKKLMIFAFLFILFAIPAPAEQSFEDYINKQFGEFQNFKEERDREFTEFLKKQWKEFNAFKGIDPDPVPKPFKIPQAQPQTPKDIPDSPKVTKKEIPPPPELEPLEKIKPTEAIVEPGKTAETSEISFDFFGTKINVIFDKNISETFGMTVTNDKISKYWKKLSTADYRPLINQTKDIKKKLNLHDWGIYLLTREISTNIHKDRNSATLLRWYILSKLGYDTKIGFKNNKIYLLLPSQYTLYGITYFTIEETRYYAVDALFNRNTAKSLKTYEGKYEGADKFAFFRTENPKFRNYSSDKTINFNYSGEKYSFNLRYNQNYIGYYKFFPQTVLNAYLVSPPSPGFQSTVVKSLNRVIRGKSEIEAVNIILRFVQRAFEYKRDMEQFGFEKYLTPEETVFYPYSDCEDKAILFAYLVREILGLDVILLDYPGHVAAAVGFNKKINFGGKSIGYKGKRYYTADPTYVNATLGMVMPLVKDKDFKVIPLSN